MQFLLPLPFLLPLLLPLFSSSSAAPTVFYPFQWLATSGAHDWEWFEAGGRSYLALANFWNASSRVTDVLSQVLVYDAPESRFRVAQSIGTSGAKDWEHFQIGETHFLAVANWAIDKSVVYRLDLATGQFAEDQFLNIGRVNDWEFFTVANTSFLAAACDGNVSSSAIFRHDGQRFVRVQELGPAYSFTADMEYLAVGNESFLALARYWSPHTGYNASSDILRLDPASGLFVPMQTVPSLGASDMTFFLLDGVAHLAVANHRSDASFNVDSAIFRLNHTTQRFELLQTLPTSGALGITRQGEKRGD